eukprot:2887639-Alexandrium_andersonii.AAC.1
MSASLVGSEMCIRDRGPLARPFCHTPRVARRGHGDGLPLGPGHRGGRRPCLLYTSDAADDM